MEKNKTKNTKAKQNKNAANVAQIFVNLPVKDLDKSIKFFSKLGFKFNPKFTDENATCMIIGKDMFAMLLVRNFFKKFTKKNIADAKKSTEVLVSLSLESRKKVDEFIKKALAAGGKTYSKPIDHGWMYQNSFADLDGHQWEIFFMDESKMPKTKEKK